MSFPRLTGFASLVIEMVSDTLEAQRGTVTEKANLFSPNPRLFTVAAPFPEFEIAPEPEIRLQVPDSPVGIFVAVKDIFGVHSVLSVPAFGLAGKLFVIIKSAKEEGQGESETVHLKVLAPNPKLETGEFGWLVLEIFPDPETNVQTPKPEVGAVAESVAFGPQRVWLFPTVAVDGSDFLKMVTVSAS